MKINKQRVLAFLPATYFLVVALLVFWNLLGRGYILTLDMIFTPGMEFATVNVYGLYNELPRDILLNLAARIIPADILQKILLVAIFTGGGIIFYYSLRYLFKLRAIVAIAAATLYIWNPFTYTRLLAGNWPFLIGYAATPLFLYFVYRFHSSKHLSNKWLLYTSLFWFGVSLFSIHHLFLYGLIFLIWSIVTLVTKKDWDLYATRSILMFFLVGLLSLSWFLPSLFLNAYSKYSIEQLNYFAPQPDLQYGLSANLLSFHGFWAEQTLGPTTKASTDYWWLVFSLISIPVLISCIFLVKTAYKKKIKSIKLILIILLIGIAGIILAHGAYGPFYWIWDLFFIKLPILYPFRDSQKFLSLYVLAYSIFMAIGLNILYDKVKEQISAVEFRKRYKLTFFTLTSLLIWAFCPTFINLNQTLSLSTYPNSWHSLNANLNSSGRIDKVLILPWVAYARFPFATRQIMDPSPSFFNGWVINATTPIELHKGKCETEYSALIAENRLSLCLNSNSSDPEWIEQIKAAGIDYLVFNKLAGYSTPTFLFNQEHFRLETEDPYSLIFKVN